MPLWDHTKCDQALQSQFGVGYKLPETAMCAGAEGRDACDVSGLGIKIEKIINTLLYRVMEEVLLFVNRMVNGIRLELLVLELDVAELESLEFTQGSCFQLNILGNKSCPIHRGSLVI